MAVFTISYTASRVLLLLTIALSFFATVVFASPIPAASAELAAERVRDVDPSTQGGDLEKRITHNGRGTYFYQNGNEGACGKVHSDATFLVATSHVLWEKNGSGNCGQYVHISSRGKTATAVVADECPDAQCDVNHLDMSEGLFRYFAPLSMGEIDITWNFMPPNWHP